MREVPHLARIDDHDRQGGRDERRDAEQFVAAGRFEHDELRGQRAQPLDQRVDPALVIRDRPALRARADGDDQLGLRDVDADEHAASPREGVASPGLVRIRARPSRPPQLFGLCDG